MIRKMIKSSIYMASVMVLLTGCADTGPIPPKVKNVQNNEQPVTLKYNIEYLSKLDKDLFQYNLLREIYKKSDYVKYNKAYEGSSNGVNGVRIKKKNGFLVVDYVRGSISESKRTPYEYVSKVEFKYLISDEKKDQQSYHLNLKYPMSYTYTGYQSLIGEVGLVDSFNKLESDAHHLFETIPDVTLKYSYKFKGEVNTQYPSSAIYANFKRLSGEYNWRLSKWWRDNKYNSKMNEIKKENTFTLNYDGKTYPLNIQVYPYRNGSKVVYNSFVDFTINGKNEVSLNNDIMKKIHEQISKIAND